MPTRFFYLWLLIVVMASTLQFLMPWILTLLLPS